MICLIKMIRLWYIYIYIVLYSYFNTIETRHTTFRLVNFLHNLQIQHKTTKNLQIKVEKFDPFNEMGRKLILYLTKEKKGLCVYIYTQLINQAALWIRLWIF